jgi:hypothetical protein
MTPGQGGSQLQPVSSLVGFASVDESTKVGVTVLLYAVHQNTRAKEVWISTTNLMMDEVCLFRGLPGPPTNMFVNGTMYCWDRQLSHSYWLKEEDYTCEDFDQGDCPCPELKADSDIAGIGVRTSPSQRNFSSS